ncbi:methyl-accepting chemotaxis protein [uncultured Gammaproteobacteria bacterium]
MSADVAAHGGAQAQAAVNKMAALRDASNRIGSIVNIISGIASQTNLLALNATIEAARAGEAGRGFAVVANEVKTLSGQTQKATVEISQRIKEIQDFIVETSEVVAVIGGTITSMHEATSEIAAAVTEQQSATDEIARNVQFVSGCTDEISHSIGLVSNSANLTREASDQVKAASGSMAGQAERLSLEVKDFLCAIKGAGTRHEFERLATTLPAEIGVDGKTMTAQVQQISIGGAWLSVVIQGELGCMVDLRLPSLGQVVKARLAGSSERGTRLQFPMDNDHLVQMTKILTRLELEGAHMA